MIDGKYVGPVAWNIFQTLDSEAYTRTQAQQLALSALRMSAWAKRYYRGKRAEGKRHQHALRCLANLLMKIAFAIWRDQTTYDENRHLAQIMRHQLRQKSSMA